MSLALSPSALGRRASRQILEWAPALLILVGALVLWQGAIAAFHIQQFLLPKPTSIAHALIHDGGTLWPAGWTTFKEALGGFVIGSLLGMLFAGLMARFRVLGSALMPIAIAANAVPVIAFAPIFDTWFNPLSPHSKMAISAVLCFFPVMVNTLRGLTSVRPQQVALMKSYAATNLEILRHVRIPTALPYVFTSLKVASVLAMIGSVVGEYFGGSFNAIGVLIRSDAQIFDFTTAWAGIVVVSVFGIALYLAVAIAERVVVRWSPELRG